MQGAVSIPGLRKFHMPWVTKHMRCNYCACAPEPSHCCSSYGEDTALGAPSLSKVGNQKGNQGAAGVTLHTRRPPAHAELLLLAVCVASSARAALSGCPGCVLLVAGPCQQLLGPSAHTAEPAEAPGSAPVPARALGTVTLCGPPSPSVGASDSHEKSPRGKADSGQVSARPRAS